MTFNPLYHPFEYLYDEPHKTIPAEDRENYRPGGYLPVEIGQKLNNGQYTILAKLGHGTYATVWLARDKDSTQIPYVAIKVLEANTSSSGSREESANTWFRSYSRFVTMLRSFKEPSLYPNDGQHLCLVFEPMGPSCYELKKESSLGFRQVHRVITCVAEALRILHAHQTVHGDLRPLNIFQEIGDLSRIDPSQLEQRLGREGVDFESVIPLHAWIPHIFPRTLLKSVPLHKYVVRRREAVDVKVGDLGGSFSTDRPPATTHLPITYAPPEALLGFPLTEKIDIWSFGCTIYELATRREAFQVGMFPSENQALNMNRMMYQFEKKLGPLPDKYNRKWQQLYTSQGVAQLLEGPDYDSDVDVRPKPFSNLLKTQFHELTRRKLKPGEQSNIWALIEGCLKLDPDDRLSAKKISEIWGSR